MLRPPPTALALAAAATGSAHLDGVVSGALPSAATAHMSLGAAGGLVGEARCDGRDETRTTVIQELIKLLGGLCGSVVAVGTYWYVRQTQRKKRDADTEDTRNMSLRVRGGAPKEKRRAAPLLNAPAQITSKKQKAKATASITSAALTRTAFSSTRASTLSAAIAASLASTAGPWDGRQLVCLEAVADLLQRAHDLMELASTPIQVKAHRLATSLMAKLVQDPVRATSTSADGEDVDHQPRPISDCENAATELASGISAYASNHPIDPDPEFAEAMRQFARARVTSGAGLTHAHTDNGRYLHRPHSRHLILITWPVKTDLMMTNDPQSPLWEMPEDASRVSAATTGNGLHETLAAFLDGSNRLALTVAGAAVQALATGGCAPGIMNLQFVYDVPDQEIGTSITPPSTAHLAACADLLLSQLLFVGDEVLISLSGAKSRAALMEWLDVHPEVEWQQLGEPALSELGVPVPYEVLHARLLIVRVPARFRQSGAARTLMIELRTSYIADVTFGHHNLGVLREVYNTNIARSLRLLPPAAVTRQDPHLWPVLSEGADCISETTGHNYVTPSQRGGEWSPYDVCADDAEKEEMNKLVTLCMENASLISGVRPDWQSSVRSLLGSKRGGQRGGQNAQIEVRIAQLRATWTGTLEELELAVEAMRKKAADDAIARGQNAQIEVRIAQLRATWPGTPEELELAEEAMRKKAADDASAGGQNSRQTEGDLVRLELVLPAGDSRAQLPLISTPDLEILFKGASAPNSRRVALNKTVCNNLGFAHLLGSKARQLMVSLKFSPPNEMTITSNLGTSLKPGWEGAELRAVLVRKAAGVAAKDDKEDEEDDA